MIQIDMPMPENCRMCPVCSEYDICLIPVDGKGFGEQNVSEFTEDRPEWCQMNEQEAVVRCKDCEHCYFASNRIPSEQNYACGKHGFDVAPDWFCADGERKSADEKLMEEMDADPLG